MRVHIRWMIRRDMCEVLQIEQESFGEAAWTEEDFLRCLRQRNCIGMVAESGPEGETVVGFMIYELHKYRLSVLKFAVGAGHRRQDVGSAMVSKLCSKLSSHRRKAIYTTVRETNLGAQLFLRSQGFRAIEVTRGHYGDDSPEDGYVFRYLCEEDSRRELEASHEG